ncbi:MAG: TraR/DksA family transcriptional regulator [Actinobacteria bacterium]|nr:TraR/DksA family transcriptional regulator [Actinomycetota bacterium]
MTPAKPGRHAPSGPKINEDESPWTKPELNAVRKQLEVDLARQRTVVAEAEDAVASLIRDGGEGAGDDQADAGTKTFEREHELSLLYNAQMLLEQTERALQRLATGSYGKCEDCGGAIGKHRLQYMPRATLCRVCKEREDRR